MALVEYSDSSTSDNEEETAISPPAKKRKLSAGIANGTQPEQTENAALPALPSTFHDMYSSTVRTSTKDDPSLHGGRKRVTPHVEGNWPTHVYLEWLPSAEEYDVLATLIDHERQRNGAISSQSGAAQVQSLLENDLRVPLPLHVSLSRPLVLKTEQKEGFLDQLKRATSNSGVKTFNSTPEALTWHPNENGTRWFLVLRLRKPEKDELSKLLAACNNVAEAFKQPLLYVDQQPDKDAGIAAGPTVTDGDNKFHISIAWLLSAPMTSHDASSGDNMPPLDQLATVEVAFAEVKVRIGQDVISFPLPARRGARSLFG